MTLKRTLEDSSSGLCQWFKVALGNTRPVQRGYSSELSSIPPILPITTEGTPPYDVLGHAIHARLTWGVEGILDVGHVLTIVPGTWQPSLLDALADATSMPVDQIESDRAARLAWTLGLIDRWRRTLRTDEVWYELFEASSSLDDLLTAIPDRFAVDVAEVAARCASIVREHHSIGVRTAPTFAGSMLVGGADADYITADGNLVEIKSSIKPELKLRDLRQLLAYALLDFDDRYNIKCVSVLAARYGVIVSWPLDDMITGIAGRPTSIAQLRTEVEATLSTNNGKHAQS